MGPKHVGRLAPGRARTAERRRQALDLRAAGVSFRGIANALGISVGQAYADVDSALLEVTKHAAEQVLELELARLDQLQASVWPAARQGDVAAANTALRVIETRLRLFGYLRGAGVAVNQQMPGAPQLPHDSVIVIQGATKEEYIDGLRAARGELPAPLAQNGNGNGHATPSEWIEP